MKVVKAATAYEEGGAKVFSTRSYVEVRRFAM